MKKRTYILIMGLFAALMFGYGMLLNTSSVTPSVQAQKLEAKGNSQKWEHCSVLPVNSVSKNAGKVTGEATIYYIQGGNYKSEKVEVVSGVDSLAIINKVKTDAIAKAISKLQDEGWEMVGEGSMFPYSSTDQKVLYFKRQLW